LPNCVNRRKRPSHRVVKGLALEMALSYRRLAARLAKKMKDGAQTVGFWLLQPSMGATRTEAARIGGVSVSRSSATVFAVQRAGPDGLLDGKTPPEPPSSKTAPGDRPVIESGPLVHPVVRWRLRSGAMDLRAIPHHDRQADAQPRAARHRLQQNSARPRPCRLRKEPYPNSKEGPHVLAAAWRDRHAPRSQHPLRRDLPRARRSTFMRTSIANAGSGELDQAAQGAFQPRRE
jgi:hypothetical protein